MNYLNKEITANVEKINDKKKTNELLITIYNINIY